MGKLYELIHQKFIEGGFTSKIVRDDFIAIDYPYSNHPSLKHYFVRFHINNVLVFTTVEIKNILLETHSKEDLAYALSEVAVICKDDGVSLTIKDGALIVSSIIKTSFFTSADLLYRKIYDKVVYCQSAFNAVIDLL